MEWKICINKISRRAHPITSSHTHLIIAYFILQYGIYYLHIYLLPLHVCSMRTTTVKANRAEIKFSSIWLCGFVSDRSSLLFFIRWNLIIIRCIACPTAEQLCSDKHWNFVEITFFAIKLPEIISFLSIDVLSHRFQPYHIAVDRVYSFSYFIFAIAGLPHAN